MKNIFKKTIEQISELIILKQHLRDLYKDNEDDDLDYKEITEAKQIDYKLKNYKKWIAALRNLIEEYGDGKITDTELKTLKL